MSSKMRLRIRWLVVAAVLALAQSASVAVQAQFFWNQQDQSNRQRSRPDRAVIATFEPSLHQPISVSQETEFRGRRLRGRITTLWAPPVSSEIGTE
jgi:hypothetical protein